MVSLSELRLREARARIGEVASAAAAPAELGRIRLRPHQRLAVARVTQALARDGGCLLADDVGRGKTYVALAVARTWQQPLLVVPASLRQTWVRAMEQASVPCTMITHEALSRGAWPTVDHDGVIVDESHRFRSPDAKRHAALARVTAFTRVLLLSATPLQNRTLDLAAQLAFFLGSSALRSSEAELARFVVRGTGGDDEADLPGVAPPVWLRTTHDDGAVLRAILALPPPARPFDAGDAGVLRVIGLVRAWASSRAALLGALRRRMRAVTALEQCAASGMLPARRDLRAWRGLEGDIQLAFAPLLVARRVEANGEELVAAVSAERLALDRLLATVAATPDPDHARVSALRALRVQHPATPILAFSELATTVGAFYRLLRADSAVGMLTAGEARIASGRLSREALLERFAPVAQGARDPIARERVTLLLATDLLSEGMNLQDASIVVHLDLPWNPARLAQRLGRIRRPGGAAIVHSYLMAPPATTELLLRVDARLRAKLARAERAIGRTLPVLPELRAGVDVAGRQHERGEAISPDDASSAESLGAVMDRVAGWRRRRSPTHTEKACEPLVAAATCAESGWLAALDDGRLLACRAGLTPNTGPAVAWAVEVVCGVARTCMECERRLASGEADEWLRREQLAQDCGVTEGTSPLYQLMERHVARVLRRTSRHERARMLALSTRLRDALCWPCSLGAERALEALMASHSRHECNDAEWFERSLAILTRRPARRLRFESPRVVALIIVGPAYEVPNQRGDHLAMRPRGPTAQPVPSTANATLLSATGSTDVHVAPPSRETSVPVSPTATSRRPLASGTNATAER